MKKQILIIVAVMFLLMETTLVNAASLEINWINPEKYRDIKAGNQHRKSFQEQVFKELEEHLSALAMKLPEEQILKIDVTDIDLAGDVNIGGIERVRIITELYFPRMKFSYQLLNADKSVVSSDEVDLKDMSFMMHSNLRYKNKTFGYERKMLDEWFKDTFSN